MSSKQSSHSSPPTIVSLPSMSSHLFVLPQAKSLNSLPIHPSQSAQHRKESEAKLKKALERNVARQNSQPCNHSSRPLYPPPTYSEPNSPNSHSPIMMRSRQKPF